MKVNNFDKAVNGEVVTKVVSTDVVEFKEATILQAISEGGELDFLTEQLREKVATFEHDLTTGVGRKRSASFAHNISRAKTKVLKFAKSTIAEDEAKIKKVKASLKNVGADFDELRDAARLPLSEWEAEDARLKAVESARISAENEIIKFNLDHEMGLLLDEKYDRELEDARIEAARIAKETADKEAQEAKELAAKQEAERIERDARIAAEAAQKAIDDAAAKAKAEAERVERDKREALEREEAAKRQAAQAERDKIAAEERAKVQAEEAEKRRIEAEKRAKEMAKIAAENARVAEIVRQEKEAAEAKADQDKRDANTRNVALKRKQAKDAFIQHAGLDEPAARKAVLALDKKVITNCSIKY
jgi:hypothetical protein